MEEVRAPRAPGGKFEPNPPPIAIARAGAIPARAISGSGDRRCVPVRTRPVVEPVLRTTSP